jgi:amidohydrolase
MPLMASDDFCHYAVRVPGVYFFLHTNNRQKGIEAFNHNPGFDVDESVLWEGVAAYVATAWCYLANISK